MAPSGTRSTMRPASERELSVDDAAHLLRRAGFGASRQEAEAVAAAGLERSLDRLFAEDAGAEAEQALRSARTLSELGKVAPLRALWLVALRESACPGREKLALFWHGHFATSMQKVQDTELMWRQVELFRRAGTGGFRELVKEVARDPAMILWLDGNANRRRRPNENFARELMELFTLGLGPYTEHDVQEAARAFAGWHVKNGQFWRNERALDTGEKEVLGRRAALDGDAVIDLCVDHPSCAPFLASKLLRFYVHPEPPRERVEDFAQQLRSAGGQLLPALRALFSSEWFYSEEVRRACIKSPLDYSLGTLKALSARCSTSQLAEALGEMGLLLLEPPSVEGWHGGRAWINSHTLRARERFAEALAFGGALKATVDWPAIADGREGEELVEHLIALLLQAPLGEGPRRTLVQSARSAPAELGHWIMTLPEYQLC